VGRHRNDPLGHGRYVIAVGAIVLLLVLIGVAVFALRSALATKPSSPNSAGTPTSQTRAATGGASGSGTRSKPPPASPTTAPQAAPTLQLDVTGGSSRVFVRIPGGDVLLDDTLGHGRHAEFDQSALDVVIYDGGAVQVTVNGKQRPLGKSGQRVQFTAHGSP
jgi:hypothetical protein